jgi:hypothetical protein
MAAGKRRSIKRAPAEADAHASAQLSASVDPA